jgi:hypothetical protein
MLTWISEEDHLPVVGQSVLLASPRRDGEWWDMKVACILIHHEGVIPLPIKRGSKWATQYYWGSPRGADRSSDKLITGNNWWAYLD